MSAYPFVWIEWEDAASHDGWKAANEIDAEPQKCTTTGFLIKETDKALLVASTIGGDDACAAMIIPKACITDWQELSKPEPEPEEVDTEEPTA